MERRRSPAQFIGFGCLGLLLLVLAVAGGGLIGYLAFQYGLLSTATPTPQRAQGQILTPPAASSASTPTMQAAPRETPTAAPVAPRAVTPTPQPEPTPGPAVIPDWPTYEDPGYIRFQHPPHWLVITTPEAPASNLRSCHCYWILMSELMVQNGPSPEAVADWFNTKSLDGIPPGGIWMEILRLDSEYAPHPDFLDGTPQGSLVIGNQYEAEVYQLDPNGRIRAYHYRDGQGRPWVIVVRAPDGFDRANPQVQRLTGVLATIDHR